MSHSSVPMDLDTREKSDHLVDSCKRLSINWMAEGLRLYLGPVMEFFSFLNLLKHTLLLLLLLLQALQRPTLKV